MQRTSRRVVLAAPPTGVPTRETFRIEQVALPTLSDNQVLTRTLYCSADPGTRSRLSAGASYAPPLKVGETIDGFCVGEVLESANPRFAVGDLVALGGGWAEHVVFPGRGYMQKIPHRRLPLSYWIGVLGVPGMTAWFGLKRVAQLKAGERVLVTSAAGPVGATAGQIAKAMGAARVVGVAGGAEKCAWVAQAGFDAAVDYKADPNLTAALLAASPEGYDVLFDNVGNAMIDGVIPLLRPGGRIVVSGQVADYNTPPGQRPGLTNTAYFIASRLRMEGLVVFDDLHGFSAAQEELGALIESGAVKVREERFTGLEAMPDAFIGLFTGAAFGRRIIQVGAEP
ncbi:MAG: NADP-dependent oxidoreductase [Hyphomonadaceae bacterium]|nr:NADP-dependent oxidoreductase [Hyphomonadaceae bacterium]MBX3510266.1 NADP-dependent oxidoreductase [Hyphomonadaceae bacterium]